DNQRFFPDTKLWPQAALPGLDGLFAKLALTGDLNDQPGVNVDVRGPVLDVGGLQDAYDKTIDVLHSAGYVDGRTLFPIGYDWRRSVTDPSVQQALTDAITTALQHRPRVDILADSQGGLVVTAFLQLQPDLAQQ